ncbi:MAG TPA: PfkB family carbohydrate kinase [Bacteroidales bacterium]|nr:PfkB family carbohydrate kinase [Bacteroidales bacterium]
MRKIYCIGETVYDIIFQNGKAVESRPGGPVLNTAVSLGKLGEKVYVVGDQADDAIGNIIADFLAVNNVSTKYLTLYNGAKSRLLLAFLNDFNEPLYSFYKIRTDDEIKITFPEVRHDDIVLFGSFTSIKKEVREDFVACIKAAKEVGALIIYDPNFRPAHIKIRDKVMDYIYENISLSSIVKGSNEDFQNIFESSTAYAAKDIVTEHGCNNFIYTANKYGVNLFTGDFHKVFDVPRIEPVSTVGAGDNFSAGLIYALIKENVYASDLGNLDHDVWRKIIRVAIDFAINVCLSYDNYISDDFVVDYLMNGRIKEC